MSQRILLSAAGVGLALLTLVSPDMVALTDSATGSVATERDAVLLEVCDLPDKQLTLSESDLDGIVSRFNPQTPLKVEHLDTVFDPLGSVQRIWRDGGRLLGRLVFAPQFAAFVAGRGGANVPLKLSCGLSRSPLTLSEVSLVLKPRLQAACLLSEDDAAELVRLRLEVSRQKVDAQVIALKLAGKIVPATEAAARVLLSAGDSALITLADGASMNTAAAFAAYLAAQPALVTLGELQAVALASQADEQSIHATDEVILNADQRAWLEKSLGVKPEDVAKMMTADKKKAGTSEAGGRTTGSLAGMDRPSAQMRGG